MKEKIIYIIFIFFCLIFLFESTLEFPKIIRWIFVDLFIFGFALDLGIKLYKKYSLEWIYSFNIVIFICGILNIIRDFYPEQKYDKMLDVVNYPIFYIVTGGLLARFIFAPLLNISTKFVNKFFCKIWK